MQPARGVWGKHKSIVWGRSSWVVHQINMKLMCLLKKKIFLRQIIELTKNLAPRPRTTSCEEGTSRALTDYLMAMLLGPANSSIMVRHFLDVREGALPSDHTIPTLNLPGGTVGYPAQPGLTLRIRRLPSPTRINLEDRRLNQPNQD